MMGDDIQAGWVLLQVSAAAWLFYAGSRGLDWYRVRTARRKTMIDFIQRRWAVPRENRRI
jgi:hypothetical protein